MPTVGDDVPGYEASTWIGVGAPKGTPNDVIDRINKEINAVLSDPKVKTQFANMAGTVLLGSPADFGTLIADETDKWGKVICAANIKADWANLAPMFHNVPNTDGKADPKIVPPWLRIPWWKGLGADSEEKREPVSDINTVVVDSLKALDPEGPIRDADMAGGALIPLRVDSESDLA